MSQLQARLERTEPGRFRCIGALTVTAVAPLRESGLQQFAAENGQLQLDLEAVSAVDSAGLALLIDWLAWCARHDRTLSFRNLPAAMQSLADISEVRELLQTSGATSG
jgi:ABC-type transporter Mla MlaB component